MEKKYILKFGGFYLTYYYVSSECITTNFVESLELGHKENALVYSDKLEAEELANLLYVVSAINFDVEELIYE